MSSAPPSPMPPLAGKTLFITGASRGIGLAIARRATQVLAPDFFLPDDIAPPPNVVTVEEGDRR